MERKEMMKKIRSTILEWGPFDINELEGFEAPVFSHNGKAHYMLIEKFNPDDVSVATYINEIPLGSDLYSYNELIDETLNDILVIVEAYDSIMWAARERGVDYDH